VKTSTIIKLVLLFILVGIIFPWKASIVIILPGIVLWKFIIPKKPAPVSIGSYIFFWIALSVWFAVIYQFL